MRFMQAAILANVALIVETLQSKHAHVRERVRLVTAALKFHDIPGPLVQRVVDSIEYYASQCYGAQHREAMDNFPEQYVIRVRPACNVCLVFAAVGD